MKKRKFDDGGFLSEEAKAAGLSMGRNERISDADRAAAIEETTGPGSKGFKHLSDKEAADMMGREVNMPEAVAIPVPAPRRMTGRALDEGSPEAYTAPRSTVAAPAPRARVPAPRPIPPQNPDLPNARRPRTLIDTRTFKPRMTSSNPKPRSRVQQELDRYGIDEAAPYKKGGAVKASKRGDGIAQRGKTKGRLL